MIYLDPPEPESERELALRRQVVGYLSSLATRELYTLVQIHMQAESQRRKLRAEAMRSYKTLLMEDSSLGFDDQTLQISMHVLEKAARKDD